VLVAFGIDGDSVVAAIRDYLADEPICKELGFATSGGNWAMLLEATEERDKDGVAELCDALNEFVWEVWLSANGRTSDASEPPKATAVEDAAGGPPIRPGGFFMGSCGPPDATLFPLIGDYDCLREQVG
jgi:hypothetical protein